MSETEYLSTRKAAVVLGLSLGTVQKMVESGALEAWKTSGGHRRILATSVSDYLGQRPGSKASPARLDVLIAEDSPTLQGLYKAAIEKWDFPVSLRLVDNGFDGLLQVGQCKPDVLITDLMMPGMDGFEMIRRLRGHKDMASMDIVVVSGLDDAEVRANGGLPADIVVYKKPVPFAELKGYLRALYQARRRQIQAP